MMTWKDKLHNPLLTVGACLCIECRAYIRENLRCPARFGRQQCGDYKGHRGDHTRLVATVFLP